MTLSGVPLFYTHAYYLYKQKNKEEASESHLSWPFSSISDCHAVHGPYEPLGFLVPVFPDEVGGVDDNSEAFFIEQEHHFPSKRRR